MGNEMTTTDSGDDGTQTIPTYLPQGGNSPPEFVGFLSPKYYQMFMQNGGAARGGSGAANANLIGLGADAGLATYLLFGIGQLESDFDAAKQARSDRYTARVALLTASTTAVSSDFSAKLKDYLDADDKMSRYQMRVIDGQLKGFWAGALAAGGRALGDLLQGSGGMGQGTFGTWVMAAGGAFLLATLFDRQGTGLRNGNTNPTGFRP